MTNTKANSDLANRLRKVRDKLNLSQSQAAAAWGINVRTIQAWEQGQRAPRGLALAQLDQLLDRALEQAKKPRQPAKGARTRR